MPSLAILFSAISVRANRADKQTHNRNTDADDRYTDATTVGVSK